MVTNLLDPQQGNRFLPLAYEKLSRVAQTQNRPVIVINSTYVENIDFEDPTVEDVNHMFIILNTDGGIITSPTTFQDALKSAGKNPIVLLYTPNHWKAVIPNLSTKSSDKSSD